MSEWTVSWYSVIDVVIVNTGRPSAALLRRYRRQAQELVTLSRDEIAQLPYEVMAGSLIGQKELIRHNPDKLAAVLIEVLLRGRMTALRRPAAIRWHTIPRGSLAAHAAPEGEVRRAKRAGRSLWWLSGGRRLRLIEEFLQHLPPVVS